MDIWRRHTSINVEKVLWTCTELGLAHERVDVGGEFGGLDSPEYRQLNPNGRIPMLEDDCFVLRESNAIVRYLPATRAPGTLCPTSPRKRADAERWMDSELCHVLPAMAPLFFDLVRKVPEYGDPATLAQAKARAEAAWRVLDAHVEGRQYILGDALTIADIPLGAFVYR